MAPTFRECRCGNPSCRPTLFPERAVKQEGVKSHWHVDIVWGLLSVNVPFLLYIPGEQIGTAF